MSTVDTGRRTAAAAPLIVFGVVLAALVIPLNLLAAALGADAHDPAAGSPGAVLALFGQAFVPVLAALAAWAVARERPAWGFRRAPWGTVVAAWAIGLLAAALPYAVAWSTGLVGVTGAMVSASVGGLPVAAAVVIAAGPAVLGYAALAVGEQLGWSSFLAVRLLARRPPAAAAVVVGVCWAAFHLPLMLIVPGAVAPGVPTAWAVAMFVGQCVALAFPLVGLRARTGSLWPVLVLHGALNAVLYTLAEPATVPSPAASWLLGEGGLLTTAGVALVVVLTRRWWRP